MMAVVTARDNWNLVTRESNMNKGPLVRVELQPGHFVKKYEQDAAKLGYVEDDDGVWRESQDVTEPKKKEKPQEDKSRRPQGDKGTKKPEEKAEAESIAEPADDFTEIDGVGPATARSLAAHGVTTFDELRTASLDFLGGRAASAIEDWRDSG